MLFLLLRLLHVFLSTADDVKDKPWRPGSCLLSFISIYFICTTHSFRRVLFLLSIHYYFSTFVSSSLFSIYLLCHTTGDINQLRTIHLYARREESITFTMLEEAPPQEDLSSLLVSFTTWSCWVMELLTVIFVMLSWINTA